MSSNDEDIPIGKKPIAKGKLTGVVVKKSAGFGVATISKPAEKTAAAVPFLSRNTSLAPIIRRVTVTTSQKVQPAVATMASDARRVEQRPLPRSVLPAMAPLEEEEEETAPVVIAQGPLLPSMGATAAPTPVDVGGDVEEFRRKVLSFRTKKDVSKVISPPVEAPQVSSKEFFGSAFKELESKLNPMPPIEIAPEDGVYRPISAPTFQDFMIQTYAQYSPYLKKILEEGVAEAQKPKEIDPDACKRRDPNKVENFYYQKLVRDYLQYNSPYRGLLVYHGLGTGKTCTSIAAAEALYWGGKKIIYVLTPATLSNNYRREIAKCGYFPLSKKNYWSFLKVQDVTKPGIGKFKWLTDVLGLPEELVAKQGGGWVPNPDKPSNWDVLDDLSKASIEEQQKVHMAHRFRFIHYNGVSPVELSALAMSGARGGRTIFDDAVVIIDEIHNLVRTINGTEIGSKPYTTIMYPSTDKSKKTSVPTEPHDYNWNVELGKQRPGFKYPRGYTLYRLLQNAVGAKIIALSATPMINYAQELAILMNIIGGEQRTVSISLKGMDRSPDAANQLTMWAKQHPEIDFYAIEEGADGRTLVLNVTPVPFGFAKVVGEDYATRGFVSLPPTSPRDIVNSRERNMDRWAVQLLRELETTPLTGKSAGKTLMPKGGAEAANVAVETARAGTAPIRLNTTGQFKIQTFPLLPDVPSTFVENFVDRKTLKIQHTDVLKARTSGLISYYKGGSEETMPRVALNEIVRVPMSDYVFQKYTKIRMEEMDAEEKASNRKGKAGPGEGAAAGPGVTAAEADLYAQATASPATGFKTGTRAACNWVFPDEVPRPSISLKQQVKLLGIEPDRTLAANMGIDEEDLDIALDADMDQAPPAEEEEAEATAAVLPDEVAVAPPTALDSVLTDIIGTLMSGLESNAEVFLKNELATFSPKYAAMIQNIENSPKGGPVLVYSQFKTLEGLGIFAAALRASDRRYLPLDIQRNSSGEWMIPDAIMQAALTEDRPLYIMYTGDQDLDKRRMLLQLYNADVSALPSRLSEQCAELLRGAPDNRDGRVCKIFMITQSGAEGISMFNTRQVHIMEPYWNNVRLQQVIGRAIRLCSHMNLDWDDRTVEIYTYLSVFSDQQKSGSDGKMVMMMDKQMTTDETIFDIATKKQTLADGLFEIVQSSAIDCELHFHEHGEATQCFRFKETGRPMFMYHPDWEKDLQGESAMRKTGM
jgi:hypothetical protein